MFKFEITDPHLMDKDVLYKIATFFISLSKEHDCVRPVEVNCKVPEDHMEIAASLSGRIEDPINETKNPFAKPVNIPAPPSLNNIPPPPPLGAPIPPVVTAALSTPQPDLDVDGLPWDGRIHARTKTKTVGGQWKLLRGVSPELVEQVRQELETVMNIEAPSSLDETLPSDQPEDFPVLINKITSALAANKITQAQITEVVKSVGLPALHLISTRTDLVPIVSAKINEILQGK